MFEFVGCSTYTFNAILHVEIHVFQLSSDGPLQDCKMKILPKCEWLTFVTDSLTVGFTVRSVDTLEAKVRHSYTTRYTPKSTSYESGALWLMMDGWSTFLNGLFSRFLFLPH